VQDIPTELDALLQELNLLYSEMGQRAITDYDEENHHDNEITNILEGRGTQVFYQVEKDWHYRKEERRWVAMNDVSSWFRCRRRDGRVVREKLHIRERRRSRARRQRTTPRGPSSRPTTAPAATSTPAAETRGRPAPPQGFCPDARRPPEPLADTPVNRR
jgi:hypothetical protein